MGWAIAVGVPIIINLMFAEVAGDCLYLWIECSEWGVGLNQQRRIFYSLDLGSSDSGSTVTFFLFLSIYHSEDLSICR
jgi:hypothetical protein